jgi:RNA recognition motif-containing protein
MSTKLYVGNLPCDTTELDLQHLFSPDGAVDEVALIRGKSPGPSKSFAFVTMATDHAAAVAISRLSGHAFQGHALVVAESLLPNDRFSPRLPVISRK